jgi:hypothetical protein
MGSCWPHQLAGTCRARCRAPLVRTPTLDAVAAGGTRFTRAWTPSPICVPARASLATGRWVHDLGTWDSAQPYSGDARGGAHGVHPTIVEALAPEASARYDGPARSLFVLARPGAGRQTSEAGSLAATHRRSRSGRRRSLSLPRRTDGAPGRPSRAGRSPEFQPHTNARVTTRTGAFGFGPDPKSGLRKLGGVLRFRALRRRGRSDRRARVDQWRQFRGRRCRCESHRWLERPVGRGCSRATPG